VRVEFGASQTTPAVNVVGLLPGVGTPGHPELGQQALVLSAHYDHLGVASSASEARRPKDAPAPAGAAPDLSYNGADDDASGVATVLELADAFGHGPPPARTLVFLLVTGEEIGLLGTDYYVDHPAAPLEATVANVNFEMVGRPDPLVGGAGRLWLTGYERTTLGPAWAAAGLAIAPDARPDQHFYERSDNIAFVHRHVIGQTLSSYNLHDDYHTVADEPGTLDYAHMEAAARTAYSACRMLADGRLAPEWTASEGEPADPATSPPAAR
jgi:Zn-dependent M28 family amino/carboxypeptidase